jgi:ATP-binding cassette subfamily B protein
MFHNSGWFAYIRYDESKPQASIDRQLLKRVGGWIRPHSGRISIMMVLLLAIALIELIPPLLYGALINELAAEPKMEISRLNVLAFGLLVIPIASSLLGVSQRYLSSFIGERLIYDLRVAMYEHMQRMGLRFFTNTKTGDIISRFASDVVGAQSAVTNTIPNLLTNVLTLVTTLAIMISLEWRLTIVAVAALPLFLLPTRRVGRILRGIRREAAEHDAKMSSQVQETLNVSGALLVRSFGRGESETDRFRGAAGAVRDIGVRRAVVGRWFFFGLGVSAAIGTALMYWAGGYLLITRGELQAGDIVTFAAYVARLYGPVSGLSNLQVEFMSTLVSFERVFEYLDLPIEIQEKPDALALDEVAGALSFEGVSFAYARQPGALEGSLSAEVLVAEGSPSLGSESSNGAASSNGQAVASADSEPEWALRDVDIQVEPGQLVALVGPSGAGKTTLSYLIARMYDPSDGRVTLDGHDLRDLKLESIANAVGTVTQESFLFHDSIRANLAFGRPDASDDQIEAACRAANIHERIMELSEAYETIVGERGYRLSGGEKQRLALARTLLKNPRILVLDEATSHLDSVSEALIQDALERLMQGRTSIVIAHRLSTILAADQILVLQGGQVVERGQHDELLSAGGLYAELYETQFDGGLAAPGVG